jgi:hypothetical protein
VCSLLTSNDFLTTYVNANCGYGGGTVVNVGTCQWSGRQSVYIEGQGTYYYGGTCGESGYNSTQPNPTCGIGDNGLAPGTYTVSKTLNGTAQANVIGPYPSPTPGSATTTLGCYNTVAAGSYRYGGTCSGGDVYQMPRFNNSQTPGNLPNPPLPNATSSGPAPARLQIGVAGNPVGSRPAVCAAPSGGSSLNIRNAGNQTYNQTCNNNYSNVNSCNGWYGQACQPYPQPSDNCPTPVVNSVTAGAIGRWYQAYQMVSTSPTTGFVHECLADSAGNNGGTNVYPTSFMRTFGTAFNADTTANAATNLSQAYTTGAAAQQYPVSASKKIDVYSTNYMNFLYGAKACRDASGNLITAGPLSTPPAGATCSPIARKTRLQVAKDALSGLITATNSVRLGLMVYNKTDTTTADEGGNVVYAVRRMGSNAADLPAYNNRASLISAIQAVVASSRTPLTESLYEAYRYFSGRTPTFGMLATTAQGGGTVSAGRETTVGNNVDPPSAYGNVFLTNAAGTYNSPMLNNPNVAGPANCQQNFVVMITNGQPEEDASANAAIKTMAYAATTGATIAPRTDFDTAGATPNSAGAPDFRQIPTVIGGNPYGPTDAAGTGATYGSTSSATSCQRPT